VRNQAASRTRDSLRPAYSELAEPPARPCYGGRGSRRLPTVGEVTEYRALLPKFARSRPDGVNVTSVRQAGDGYNVTIKPRRVHSRTVRVIARRRCNSQRVADVSDAVNGAVQQLTPTRLPRPRPATDGGDGGARRGEPRRPACSCRRAESVGGPVTLSGGGSAVAATYRARSVLWWMERVGLWDSVRRGWRIAPAPGGAAPLVGTHTERRFFFLFFFLCCFFFFFFFLRISTRSASMASSWWAAGRGT